MSNLISEINAVLGTIDPQAVSTTTVTSDLVNTKLFNKLMVIANIGAAAGAGTLELIKSDGTTPAVLETVALTTSDANKQYVFDYQTQNVDSAKPLVGVRIVAATTNTILASAVIVGSQARYFAPDSDLATVTIVD